MKTKVRLLGHPIHPMLVVFPLGLFVTAAVFDVLFWITNETAFPRASFYMIGAGIFGALLAAVFGVIDWLGLPPRSRAWHIGLGHGVGNALVTMLFIVNWVVRRGNPNLSPDGRNIVLSLVGLGLILSTAWLGGELVYRLGIGVDPDANVNAPNSLTDRSASPSALERKA